MTPLPPEIPQGAGLVLFDGDCAFCNGSVMWLVDRDPAGNLHYAPLQSELGQSLLKHFGMDQEDLDTLVYIDAGGARIRSKGVFGALSRLGSPWGLLGQLLSWIPAFLADPGYRIFAKNRYRWFGKVDDACRIPTPEVRARFHS